MAAKYSVLEAGAGNTKFLRDLPRAFVLLSDGTPVFLYKNTSSVLQLGYTDRTAVTNIAAPTPALPGNEGGADAMVVRDSSDNLYVIGYAATNLISAQAFSKGSGLSWTAQTGLTGAAPYSRTFGGNAVCDAVWCNTGGGTSGAGHILILLCTVNGFNGDPQYAYAILDAGALLAGTGTLVTASGTQPTFLANAGLGVYNSTSSVAWGMELSADGFGATSGIAVAPVTTTSLQVGAWAVNSSGALSTNSAIATTVTTTAMDQGMRVSLIRVASNKHLLLFPSATTFGHWGAATYSSSAQLNAAVDSGAPTNMPLTAGGAGGTVCGGWYAYLDPKTANQVWVVAVDVLSGSTQTAWRTSIDLSSGVTWGTAAAQEDSFAASASGGQSIRGVKLPANGSNYADYQAELRTASTDWTLYGDYVSYLPPARRAPITVVNRAALFRAARG